MQWRSDLIGYNTLSSYGSPSYYVQKMFSKYLGDRTVMVDGRDLPTQIKRPNARDSARGVGPKTIPAMFFSATKDSLKRMIYLKVVNAAADPQHVQVELQGNEKVAPRGKAVYVGSEKPGDTNTILEPRKIIPVSTEVKGLGKRFRYTFPAYSVTVLELQLK
jgi:alpha-N-arabinofuranosidase